MENVAPHQTIAGRRRYVEFNPAQCHRNLDIEKLSALTAKLQSVTAQELREINAQYFGKYLSASVIAGLWAINLEFTRRDIAPRWRGITHFNPSAVAHETRIPEYLSDVPRLRTTAMQQKLLLRWADLQWLYQELGPSHLPLNLSWRSLFSPHISEARREYLFACIAESEDQPNRIVFDLSVPELHLLALKGFSVARVGDKHKAVRKRLQGVIQPRLEAFATRPSYTPNSDAIGRRLIYAEAIELARGSPTETARFVRWISGERVTPQAAEQMRNKVASDLKLLGFNWKKTIKKRTNPLCAI